MASAVAAAATSARYIELAKALHPRLLRFFAKYPPNQILPSTTRANTAAAASASASTSATNTNITTTTTTTAEGGDGSNVAATTTATTTPSLPPPPPPPNPFLPHKHPVTGKWQDPVYSLRRQAELVKLAREQGVEELLPFTTKSTEERIRKRVQLGLRVRGTGVGQKVKGHLYERMLPAKYVITTTATAVMMMVTMMVMTTMIKIIGLESLISGREDVRLANFRGKQDGEEENGYAGDAEIGQGVAEGKFEDEEEQTACKCVDLTTDDDTRRRGRASGPSIHDELSLRRRMVLKRHKNKLYKPYVSLDIQSNSHIYHKTNPKKVTSPNLFMLVSLG